MSKQRTYVAWLLRIAIFGTMAFLLLAAPAPPPNVTSAHNEPYKVTQCEDPALSSSERAGCKIWFYATAGNARFHAYVLPQRMPVLLDWYRVLNSRERDDRFKAWGIINDPECCTPGKPGCPHKKLEETYGMDFCPGDEELLQYVGKPGYRDPACDFEDSGVDPKDVHKGQRENSCGLEFGTSSGAMGIRKFPNPRFNPEKWKEVNGGDLTSWKGFNKEVQPDLFHSKLRDGSIEPPFYFGMSCGACHIAFDPLNPPKDPSHPKAENIKGVIGNQYTNITAIMASGEPTNGPLWRIFNYVRSGTVDTSAFPHDFNGNPGTPNGIFNLNKRPTFPDEELTKWFKTDHCAAGADEQSCWCEPKRNNKCWEKGTKKSTDPMDPNDPVMHILKGGEDSIGVLEAVQRVYINIGSCSETCWENHLTNFFVLDPNDRGFGQTPFNIGQCRRDCPNFRAIEDRLPDVAAFLLAQRPPELYAARKLKSRDELVTQLDREYGPGAVKQGKQVFADNCASCHSSQQPDKDGGFRNADFWATDDKGERNDFLSNDKSIAAESIGTNPGRALHSNHMKNHVWSEYGSETLRNRTHSDSVPPAAPPYNTGGPDGRGYYRPASLLGIWATAPYMHDNAIGPEVCGKPENTGTTRDKNSFYQSPYVDASGKKLDHPPACWPFDPSIEGRYKLFKASVDELLTPPEKRPQKMMLLDEDIKFEIGPDIWDPVHKRFLRFRMDIPKGTPQAQVGNMLYKNLIDDMVLSVTNFDALQGKLKGDAKEVRAMLDEFVAGAGPGPVEPFKIFNNHQALLKKHYMTNTEFFQNRGHAFGTDLSAADKKALKAFLATL